MTQVHDRVSIIEEASARSRGNRPFAHPLAWLGAAVCLPIVLALGMPGDALAVLGLIVLLGLALETRSAAMDLAGGPAADAGRRAAIPATLGEPPPGQLAKRAFDILAASLALLALMPMFPLLALCIRLDSRGPILFRQNRVGQWGRVFRVYKLRTMTCCEDGAVVRQASRGDARVTRIGRVLRTHSIDELPQLLNVLLGDMSLVGPRPHAVAHDIEYGRLVAGYADRRAVKPGITGWAQVNGCRGETRTVEAMRERIEHDLAYIRAWSLWLDLAIIVMTVREVVRPRAAY